MPKRVSPLSQLKILNAKPRDKAYKLADGGGLYLEVTPAGGKHWRMKYHRPDGREAKLNFGAFPVVSLSEAREKRDSARQLVAAGTDRRSVTCQLLKYSRWMYFTPSGPSSGAVRSRSRTGRPQIARACSSVRSAADWPSATPPKCRGNRWGDAPLSGLTNNLTHPGSRTVSLHSAPGGWPRDQRLHPHQCHRRRNDGH